jgi:hypothetical protein
MLLGPSSFEHWFESYLCITVESLSFLEIATRSLFVYLSLPLLCSPLPRAAAVLLAMCAAPAVSAPLGTSPRATPASAPPLPALALAYFRRNTSPDCLPELCFAAARRRSITRATSYLPMFHASLLCRAVALPIPCWPARASSTSQSSCLSSATAATRAAGAPAPACAWTHLLLNPERLPSPLVHALAFAHFFSIQFSLLRSPPHTGPAPQPQLTVGSVHHCSPSSIRSANSTPTIHCSSPSDPIPISSTRTARPQCRRAHSSAAARPPIDPPIQALSAPINNTISTTSSS